MAQVLVRNLGSKTLMRLKTRAKQHKRSLQAELRAILEREAHIEVREASMDVRKFRILAARIRKKLGPGPHTDSGDLQAESRGR